MVKHDFDLCQAYCNECNGINIKETKDQGVFECLNSGKILKKVDETTLREYSMVDIYSKTEKQEIVQGNISVDEFIKTLTPITDFSSLQKGDKIFNRYSLNVDYVDTFDHIEHWSEGREIVFYKNFKGEEWHGRTENNWFYYKK